MNAKDIAQNVIKEHRIGVLSTSKVDKPNARYMVFYNDGLELYTKTSDETNKVDEIEENPNVHVLLGYNEPNKKEYIEVRGTAKIVDDEKTIEWIKDVQQKTRIEDSATLQVIHIKPEQMIVHSPSLDQPEVVTV